MTKSFPILLLLAGCSRPDPTGGFLGLSGDHPPSSQPGVTGAAGGETGEVDTAGETGADTGGETAGETGGDTAQGTSAGECPPLTIQEIGLHVTLAWPEDVDLDLHLMTRPDALFQPPDDCTFCNLNPDWGTPRVTEDDPMLVVDLLTPGCEVIEILAPADGAYTVAVHHFRDNDGVAASAGTVEVWASGILLGRSSLSLAENEVWEVGTVVFPDATFTASTASPTPAEARTCE